MRHRYTHLVNSDPAVDCIIVERDGATVKLRLIDNQTQLTPDQLAAWMEHFQENQQAA